MKMTFDPAKNTSNKIKHGVSFELVNRWDWSSTMLEEDCRGDYGERRYRAFGLIDDRLFVLVFTTRSNIMHVISLRRANLREVKHYAKT